MSSRRIVGAIVILLALGACERRAAEPPSSSSTPAMLALPVRVLGDTGRATRLAIQAPPPPPRVHAWVAHVVPSPMSPEGVLPLAQPDTVFPVGRRSLEIDPRLQPPIPRTPADLVLPRHRGGGAVEVDVRIDESGAVSNAVYAGGDADAALVQSVIECVRRMTFYPAQQGGKPVAVWCRQRFELPDGSDR